MKILLFGKDGQVGWELQRSLSLLGNVIALGRNSKDYCGDLNDLNGIADTIEKIRPDIIINAAAYTAVDKAESDTDTAYRVNHLAPEVIAKVAKQINSLFIHYSTDYVFSGDGSMSWKDNDPTGPVNVYGKSKYLGELAIIESGCRYLILRTSWVYATKGNNFIKTMLRLAKEKNELKIIHDQYGAPTGADLIADVTANIIAQPSKISNEIYHLAASGETTWYEYANYIFEVVRGMGKALAISEDGVIPVSTEQFITPATRPKNSRLDCTKLAEKFSLKLPEWKFGVKRAVLEILENSNE